MAFSPIDGLFRFSLIRSHTDAGFFMTSSRRQASPYAHKRLERIIQPFQSFKDRWGWHGLSPAVC